MNLKAMVAIVISLCLSLTSAFGIENGKHVIVCSTTQIADFTKQIVGDDAIVKCILGSGADPHTYKPTPSDAKLVATADLCLQNGLHLEGKNWMKTLAKDAGNKPLVTCTNGIKPLKMEYETEGSDGKIKIQIVNDPHAWFKPANAAIYVNNIAKNIIKIDGKHKSAYRARAALYLQTLNSLDGWIQKQFNAIPVSKRILVTSHDAFNYFCSAYGFKNKAPVGWSTGSEIGGGMSPKRRNIVIDSIKGFGIKAIFVETSINPKLIRTIAKEAGVVVGGTLYSDAMGKQGSAGETYIGMMRENVLVIVGALN
jgi:manganese/iron transport system substrate-binding protein